VGGCEHKRPDSPNANRQNKTVYQPRPRAEGGARLACGRAKTIDVTLLFTLEERGSVPRDHRNTFERRRLETLKLKLQQVRSLFAGWRRERVRGRTLRLAMKPGPPLTRGLLYSELPQPNRADVLLEYPGNGVKTQIPTQCAISLLDRPRVNVVRFSLPCTRSLPLCVCVCVCVCVWSHPNPTARGVPYGGVGAYAPKP
jgi:hypothetical protein